MSECSFIRAEDARKMARNLALIYSEICAIQQRILEAIDQRQLSVLVNSGTVMTENPDYYDVVSGQSDNRVIQNEIQFVQDYFGRLGYNIRPQVNPFTASTLQWQILW